MADPTDKPDYHDEQNIIKLADIAVERCERFESLYANQVLVSNTSVDFRIALLRAGIGRDQKDSHMIEVGEVHLPVPVASELHRLLELKLAEYDRLFLPKQPPKSNT